MAAIQTQEFCWINNGGVGDFVVGGVGGGVGGGDGGGFVNQVEFNLLQQQNLQQQIEQKQQQIQQQLIIQQQQQEQSMFYQNNSSVFKFNMNQEQQQQSMSYNQYIASSLEQQKQEIEQFLKLQNQGLMLLMQEHRTEQLTMMYNKLDRKTSLLIKQKDEEIEKALNIAMEMENLVRNMDMEGQAWKRAAQENEAMVFSLTSSLEQLIERSSFEGILSNNGGGGDDAESFCGENEEEKTEQMPLCKGCNCRDSCVLFLPCRHLCSCTACEAFLDSCPVCTTIKKSSIVVRA